MKTLKAKAKPKKPKKPNLGQSKPVKNPRENQKKQTTPKKLNYYSGLSFWFLGLELVLGIVVLVCLCFLFFLVFPCVFEGCALGELWFLWFCWFCLGFVYFHYFSLSLPYMWSNEGIRKRSTYINSVCYQPYIDREHQRPDEKAKTTQTKKQEEKDTKSANLLKCRPLTITSSVGFRVRV